MSGTGLRQSPTPYGVMLVLQSPIPRGASINLPDDLNPIRKATAVATTSGWKRELDLRSYFVYCLEQSRATEVWAGNK